jgi:hypothetical protein
MDSTNPRGKGNKMTNSVENFEEIVKQLIASATEQRAVDFVNKVAGQIRAKGNDWIEINKNELQVAFVPGALIPVSANRLYYIGKFQMALLNCK